MKAISDHKYPFIHYNSLRRLDRPPELTAGPVRVYLLLDPVEYTVRYVGISVNPEKRLDQHMKGGQGRPEMREWIRNLEAMGMRPEVKVVSWCTPDQWAHQERLWIKWIRGQGAIYNIHAGGGKRPESKAERKWKREQERRTASRHTKKKAQKVSLYKVMASRPLKPPRLFEKENETFGR